MRVFRDYQDLAIRLTDERLQHILQHPEMVGLDDEIEHAVTAPDSVVESAAMLRPGCTIDTWWKQPSDRRSCASSSRFALATRS